MVKTFKFPRMFKVPRKISQWELREIPLVMSSQSHYYRTYSIILSEPAIAKFSICIIKTVKNLPACKSHWQDWKHYPQNVKSSKNIVLDTPERI